MKPKAKPFAIEWWWLPALNEIQQERLVARSALSLPADARSIIASQMSLSEKISRADHRLLGTTGRQSVLESQAATFASFLTTH